MRFKWIIQNVVRSNLVKATGGVLLKKMFLKISQISLENTCVCQTNCLSVFDHKACKLYQKETSARVLSCETGDIFKNIFFTEYLWWLLLSELTIKAPEPLQLTSCHLNQISVGINFIFYKSTVSFVDSRHVLYTIWTNILFFNLFILTVDNVCKS